MRKLSTLLLAAACLTIAARAGAAGLSASAPKEKPAFDPDFLFAAGQKLLAAGDINGARAVLTRTLIERTDYADAYAVRAVAEIRMGNRALAESDVRLAQDYRANGSLIQTARAEIDRAPRTEPTPQEAWETLQKHALAGDPFEKLVPFASALVKATNAVRTRWDEAYQSQLAALEKNLRDHPEQAAATLDLADFLYKESQPMGEPLSPRGGMRYYRFSEGTMNREIMHADIRAANRYGQLKEPEKQLAALQWNAAIEARLSRQALHSTPPRAVLPNPGAGGPAALRSVANLVAWSHVFYGHSLLEHQKVLEAYQIFADVGNWKRTRDIFDPQGLCYAAMERIKMAGTDPHKDDRKIWLGNAFTMQVLTQAEVADIMQRKREQTQLARTGYADQHETMQLTQDLLDLSYFQDAQPVAPGAYDPRNNPNYHGTDDPGPDAAQYIHPAAPAAGDAKQEQPAPKTP